MKFLKSILKPVDIYAHCDIPCGIYDPIAAKIAAQTVLKMAVRLEALDLSGGVSKVEQPNGIARLIRVKEDHAEIVRNELDILWHDIDDGKFGVEAKTSEFYKEIKKIKDDNPKPDNFEELKQELEVIVETLENEQWKFQIKN